MKKLFTSLTLLTSLLLFGSSVAWADVQIGSTTLSVGTTYSSSNCSAIKSGTAKLTDASNLRLDNCVISVSSGKGLTITTENLYVYVTGSLKITNSSSSSSDACLYLRASTTFGGVVGEKREITLNNTGQGQAIRVARGVTEIDKFVTFSFLGYKLNATAANGAALYDANNKTYLYLHHTKATLSGSPKAFSNIKYVGGSSIVPSDYASTGTVYVYPAVEIGDHYVDTNTTCYESNSSSSGAGITAGTIKFNYSTNTLTLSGVTATSGMILRKPDMKVECKGTNTFNTTYMTFEIRANTSFVGDGSLTVSATSGSAFSTYESANVTFQMGDVTASGTYGFNGQTSGSLYLLKPSSSTTYKFSGTTCDVLAGNLEMTNMDIWTYYTWFNKDQSKIYYKNEAASKSKNGSGTWFRSTDMFTYYNVYIAGTQLHNTNCKHFYSPDMTSGSVEYDASSKTLSLNNVTINMTGTGNTKENQGIWHEIEGLTINTTGTNTITSAANALNLGGNTTITGTGDFTITSTAEHGINMSNSKGLTLQRSSGTMAVQAKKNAYYGYSTTNLTINKSGSTGGCYKFVGEGANIKNTGLVMGSGVHIWTMNTWYNEDKHSVYISSIEANGSGLDDGTWIRGDVTWTELPLYISGEQIYYAPKSSTENRGNIYFYNQYVKGGVRYDPATKTLVLDGATIDIGTLNKNVIESNISGFKLSVKGTNTIKTGASNYSALYFHQNSEITQPNSGNKLSIESPSVGSICLASSANLSISGGVNITASTMVYGQSGAGTLSVYGSTLDCSCLYGFSNIYLADGTGYAIPNSGTYSTSTKRVQWNGADYSSRTLIQPLTQYNVYVAGIEVNSYNKDDIFADPMYNSSWGKSGSAMFSPSYNRLELSGVNITAPKDKDGIKIEANDVTVQFTGDNTITASGDDENAIWAQKAGTLAGTGTDAKLTASNSSTLYPAIYAGNAGTNKDFTIKNLEINSNGLSGQDGNNLYINGSTVNLSGFVAGTLKGFADVELQGGVILMSPAEGTYDKTDRRFEVGNTLFTGAVQFAVGDEYPLWIAGVQVNSGNAGNVTGSNITGGTVTYDNASKKLVLNGVTLTGINDSHKSAIYSEVNGLTIEVMGNCTLTPYSASNPGFITRGDTEITGSGTLNIDGQGVAVPSTADLTFTNTTVNINGTVHGPGSSMLKVNNSTVNITNSGSETILEWGNMQLDDCTITSPTGAKYNTSDVSLYYGGSPWSGSVTIEPVTMYGITVAGVPIHSKNVDDISGATGANGKMTVVQSVGKTTVTLDNFNLTGTDTDLSNLIVFSEKAGDVTINLVGDNVFTSTRPDDDGLFEFESSVSQTVSINGSGSLSSNARYGIHGDKYNTTLVIDGTTIDAGMIYNIDNLYISNSRVHLAGDNSFGTIEDVNYFAVSGCDFTTPSDAEYNGASKAVYSDGNLVIGEILIEPMQKFGITIAGVPVTDLNASSITGAGISGSVSWDAMAGRLILNNATINAPGMNGIEIDGGALSDMQIELIGDNEIDAECGIRLIGGTTNVTIYSSDGTGILKVNGSDNGTQDVARLSVRDAGVRITGTNCGVNGGTLNVQLGAIVKVETTSGTKAVDATVDLVPDVIVADGALDAKVVGFGEDYGFAISGTRVTSYLVATTGMSVYDPATKTLTVENVNTNAYIYNEKCSGLTIKASGSSTFNGGTNPVIDTEVPMIIDGTGEFNLTSTDKPAIDAMADITIKGGLTVYLNGSNAYVGNGTSTLHIDNSSLHASGTADVFVGLAGLDLNGVIITTPEGAEFADGTVKAGGAAVNGGIVVIESSSPVTKYGVTIAGIDITSDNSGSVTAPGITRGYVSYDDATKTLTLNEVELTGQGIKADGDIIIRLIGDNKITDVETAVEAGASIRIYSEFENGTLDVSATKAAFAANGGFGFEKCLITADGGERGIYGMSGASSILFSSAAVRVKGSVASVSGITGFAGEEIATYNAAYNDATKQIEVNGAVATDWIDFSEFYGLYVGATPVTRSLVYEESGEIAAGVSYNRFTGTLSLNNATIDGIWVDTNNPLNIVVEGTNVVNSSAHGSGINAPALYADKSYVTIIPNTVGSTVTFDGGEMNNAITLASNAGLVIFNDAIVLTKGLKGIVGDGTTSLDINYAQLMANATTQVITGLASLNMAGVGIFVPQGATFNASTGAVELNGATVIGQQIIINAEGDGINGISADDSDIDGIYAVDGKKLGRTQRGVNIVRRTDGKVNKVLRK